jgi:hypothetical protein
MPIQLCLVLRHTRQQINGHKSNITNLVGAKSDVCYYTGKLKQTRKDKTMENSIQFKSIWQEKLKDMNIKKNKWQQNYTKYVHQCTYVCSLFNDFSTSIVSLSFGSMECTRCVHACIHVCMDWTTGRWKFDLRQGQRIFPLASVSRPALGPTQPPVQWVPGVLSPGVKRGRGVTLSAHPHLVPRSWMSRSYISSPPKRLHGV